MIYKAQVIDTADPAELGQFWVYCPDISEEMLRVTYTSPFFNHNESGMVSIPSAGAEVLISKVFGEDIWYYIGSVVAPLDALSREGTKLKEAGATSLPDSRIYQARGIPQKTVIKDAKGNALNLSNLYNSEFFNVKAELKSSHGKRLILSDSPLMDSVILRNANGDRIKITDTADNSTAARAIELESQGPHHYISRESGISLTVVEGKEINLKNTSTGLNANPADPLKTGNINIETDHNDINLVARAEDGRIFLDALGVEGLVQIDSSGRVIINASNGSVSIIASDDINMQAQNINIDARGSLNMRSGDATSIGAGLDLILIGGEKTALEGTEIHLNSGGVTAATPESPEGPATTNYGN